ncbi:adenine phosphoribosyltransferase [candidate division KSB1 bacterium]
MEELKNFIRHVQDFPKKGIGFKDITTLLKEGKEFSRVINLICAHYNSKKIDLVLGIEARGFIFAGAVACKMNVGMIPLRKPGKLPAETIKEEYQLEYGTDALEMHADAIKNGSKILIVDDLLATGGTVRATCNLVEKAGGIIEGIAFLIELDFLKGREKFKDYDIFSILHFESE